MERYVAAKERLVDAGRATPPSSASTTTSASDIATGSRAANRRAICRSASRAGRRRLCRCRAMLVRRHRTARAARSPTSPARARCRGRHNWQNAAAAYAAARALGIRRCDAADGLVSFPGLRAPHGAGRPRSATCCSSTTPRPPTPTPPPGAGELPDIYWIAGGQPKAGGIDSLDRLLPARRQGLSDRRSRAGLRRRRWTPVAHEIARRSTWPSSSAARRRATPRRAARTPSCCCRRPAPRSTSSQLRNPRHQVPRAGAGAAGCEAGGLRHVAATLDRNCRRSRYSASASSVSS